MMKTFKCTFNNFRVNFGERTQIIIPHTDDDDDDVVCSASKFAELGRGLKIEDLKGITVSTVSISKLKGRRFSFITNCQ